MTLDEAKTITYRRLLWESLTRMSYDQSTMLKYERLPDLPPRKRQ